MQQEHAKHTQERPVEDDTPDQQHGQSQEHRPPEHTRSQTHHHGGGKDQERCGDRPEGSHQDAAHTEAPAGTGHGAVGPRQLGPDQVERSEPRIEQSPEPVRLEELPEACRAAGIERPQLGPIATGLGEIFHYIVRSEDPQRSIEELRTIHDWVIKPQMLSVAGVAEVNSWGGFEKQFQVVVDPVAERLAAVFALLEERRDGRTVERHVEGEEQDLFPLLLRRNRADGDLEEIVEQGGYEAAVAAGQFVGLAIGLLVLVELALARGKEHRDRRREIRDRDVARDVARELKDRNQ